MKPATIVTVLVVLFVAAFLFFRVIIAPYILEAHTGIMFTQIRERIEAAENFPISTKSLVAIIENSNIDWNSCRIEDEEILDGWENPIRIEFIEAERTLSFQSSGMNGQFGGSDDIIQDTQGTNQTK